MEIGNTLNDARERGLKKYKQNCKKHGIQNFAVLDNSCQICVNENARRRKKENYQFNRSRELFNEVRNRAIKKNIPFELTLDVAREMLDRTSVCPYLGIEMNSGDSRMDHRKSFDRVDPSKGYEMTNVVVCSNRANRIKNDASPAELMLLASNLQAMLGDS